MARPPQVEIAGGPRPPRYPYRVAVVGDGRVLTRADLRRLLEALVNRKRDDHQIVLVTPGRAHAPYLRWCEDLDWGLQLVPGTEGPVRQDCELVVCSDALVVLGDPGPWRRLIQLCGEARIPVRVYRHRPRLPPARDWNADAPEGGPDV